MLNGGILWKIVKGAQKLPKKFHWRILIFSYVSVFRYSYYSEIYCRGELLHTVQTAKLFNDSKTFVDMKLKQPPQKTLDAFKEFMSDHDNNPPKDDIRKFVQVGIAITITFSWFFFLLRSYLLTSKEEQLSIVIV